MVPMNVAVIPFEAKVSPMDLATVTAALQVQVARDFAPIWGISATVAWFPDLEQVPTGYMTLVLVNDLPRQRHGVHYAAGSRPVGLVKYGDSWSLMASHELLEMVVDPWGNRVLAGRSLEAEQGQVEYLLEICDPCQAESYLINGVLVSDFVTPDYYATSFTEPGLRYSFLGKVKRPREVLENGYLTWRRPGSEEIWQKIGDDDPIPLPGGGLLAALALRPWVDWTDPPSLPDDAPFPTEDTLDEARTAYNEAACAAQIYGGALKRDIKYILNTHSGAGKSRSVTEPTGELALLRALGDSSDDRLRAEFLDDPHSVLERYALPITGFPNKLGKIAPPEVFAWAADELESGNILGDGNGFFGAGLWWLAALGGG